MKLFSKKLNWKKDVFTIPNILSSIRILLLPPYLYIVLTATTDKDFYLAAGIILFSGFTDLIDGWIARTFNQITELGKLIDPVADKLTQLALAFSLVVYHKEMWLVAGLLVVKELFMLISGWLLLKRDKKLDGAKWFGKLSTATFYASMFLILLLPDSSNTIVRFLIGLTIFFLSLSFLLYIREYYYLFKTSKNEDREMK